MLKNSRGFIIYFYLYQIGASFPPKAQHKIRHFPLEPDRDILNSPACLLFTLATPPHIFQTNDVTYIRLHMND